LDKIFKVRRHHDTPEFGGEAMDPDMPTYLFRHANSGDTKYTHESDCRGGLDAT